MASLLILFRNGSMCKHSSVIRLVWPALHRQINLLQNNQNQCRQIFCSYNSNLHVLSKASYTTSLSLFKKADMTEDDKPAKKKLAGPSKDDKTVQVFDQNGLFVGKLKFWKAKAEAAKKNLRLVEMKSGDKSKKKGRKEGTESESDDSLDIPSYKLASVEEFQEVLDEAKKEKAKKDALRQVVIKSNIDKSGLDIKMNQVKNMLMKKGRLKVLIQSKKNAVSTFDLTIKTSSNSVTCVPFLLPQLTPIEIAYHPSKNHGIIVNTICTPSLCFL